MIWGHLVWSGGIWYDLGTLGMIWGYGLGAFGSDVYHQRPRRAGWHGQVPFRYGHIQLQTFLILFLLAQSKEECAFMVEANEDFARFAQQLQTNYQLWRQGGAGPACEDMCWNLLQDSSGCCLGACRLMLPALWTVYGPPWVHACIVHRLISVVRHLRGASPVPNTCCVVHTRSPARVVGHTLPARGLGVHRCVMCGRTHPPRSVLRDTPSLHVL